MAPGRTRDRELDRDLDRLFAFRCWFGAHVFVRERDADDVLTFTCRRCGYRTPIVARTADERDAMARRFPVGRSRTGV